MKNIAIFIIPLNLFLFSCSKSPDTIQVTPVNTSLEISLKDDLGNSVTGATVKLYSSESNYLNEGSQVQTSKTSGSNGVVLFENLTSIKYYYNAEKDCLTNAFGAVTTTNNLSANYKNTVTVVLSKSGTLKINNISTNPYDVYINGVLKITNMAGGNLKTFKVGLGTYNIRVLQKSGYILYPTEKTYTGNISCGSVLTCTFP
jgi:hypothetical protein